MNNVVIIYDNNLQEAAVTSTLATITITASKIFDFLDALPSLVEELQKVENDKAGTIDQAVTNAITKISKNQPILKKIGFAGIKKIISFFLKKEAIQEKIPSISFLIKILKNIAICWSSLKKIIVDNISSQTKNIKTNIKEFNFFSLIKDITGLPKKVIELFKDVVTVLGLSKDVVAGSFIKQLTTGDNKDRLKEIVALVRKNDPNPPPEAPQVDFTKPPKPPGLTNEQVIRFKQLSGILNE